ncbi:MAG TPA: hypothetical protein VKN99_25790 [Polyangia bacterium]|nr:hypothetical protein [Polyangia bacterium]
MKRCSIAWAVLAVLAAGCGDDTVTGTGGSGGSGGTGGAGGAGGGSGSGGAGGMMGACGPSGATSGALTAGGLAGWPTGGGSGPELAQNGGFENPGPSAMPAAWTGDSTFARDTTQMHSGAASLRMQNAQSDPLTPLATQTVALHAGTYRLSGWVKTQALGASRSGSGVRLNLDFRPTYNEWLTTEVISGTTDWTSYERPNIVVPQDRTATLTLEGYAHPDGTAWFDDVQLAEQLPSPLDVFLLYPNYRGMMFEDQPGTIRLDVTVTPPGGNFAAYTVTARLTDTQTHAVVAMRDYPAAPHLTAELSGCGMTTGRTYVATAALAPTGGQPLYEAPGYRLTRVPAAARASMNVTFDDKGRILLHGTPRFILGVYDSGLGYGTTDDFWENTLWSATGDRRMQDLPINLYLNYWYGAAGLDAMNALMTNLARHGVMYLQTGNCVTSSAAGGSFQINMSDAYVREFGAHTGSAGYYTADECDSVLAQGVFTQFQRLEGLDPDSITFGALLGDNELSLWRDAVDVLSTDPYPMYGAEPPGGYNHGMVADWTVRTRNVVKNARPFLTVLQFFQFTSLGRWPTRTEMRNHAYMAIVEGAKGLFWWSLGGNALADTCGSSSVWCAERVQHMDDLRAVVSEIAGLEPALLADDAPAALATVSDAAIHTKITMVSGKRYLWAYNGDNAPHTPTFTLAASAGSVSVVGEGRSVTPTGATFSDAFGPFAAHVYQIQ